MRKILLSTFAVAVLLAGLTAPGFAVTGHYVNGVEGIKGATLPPPGFYFRSYTVYYTAHDLMDEDGDELPVGFEVDVMAQLNRFIWMSEYEILGGNFFADVIVPVVYTEFELDAMGLSDDEFGLGDLYFEPFGLSWHGERWDAAFGASFFAPTAEFEADEPASPGKGFWTGMFTLGGTYYFDAEKLWSASILSRYEIHSDMEDLDLTPGDDFHFEWGIARNFAKFYDVGITGYAQWQVTEDRGDDANDIKDQVFGVGPEVLIAIPKWMMYMSLRANWEFEAEDRSEGMVAALTLTKRF